MSRLDTRILRQDGTRHQDSLDTRQGFYAYAEHLRPKQLFFIERNAVKEIRVFDGNKAFLLVGFGIVFVVMFWYSFAIQPMQEMFYFAAAMTFLIPVFVARSLPHLTKVSRRVYGRWQDPMLIGKPAATWDDERLEGNVAVLRARLAPDAFAVANKKSPADNFINTALGIAIIISAIPAAVLAVVKSIGS